MNIVTTTIIDVMRTVALLHLVFFAFGAPIGALGATVAVYLVVSLTLLPSFGYIAAFVWWPPLGDECWRIDAREKRIMLAMFGAWLGAFFAPLDWGVWWQAWPILSVPLAAVFSLLGAWCCSPRDLKPSR